jgi:hypothetical protein
LGNEKEYSFWEENKPLKRQFKADTGFGEKRRSGKSDS